MDMSEYDMVSVNNVYIDNADEDSEASSTTEFLTATLNPFIQDTHDKTALSKTHSVNRKNSNSGGTSSDTIVIIDSDSEDELPVKVPQRPTDQQSDPWLNALTRKNNAPQKKSNKDVPKVTNKKSRPNVDDCVILDENSDSNDDLGNKSTTSPEADLGYCEGDDVDDNLSVSFGIPKTTASTSGYPLTSGYQSSSEFTATKVSKSPTVSRNAKQSRKYYCTECRAVFSEEHEHDQTYEEEQIRRRFTCDFCHEEFFSERDYSSHGQSCARRCTCHFCGHVFNDIVQLKQHLFTEHAISKDNASTSNIQSNASPKSPEYSTFSSDLDTSISEPVEQEELVDSTKFPCNMCSLVFGSAANLKRHTTTKHSRRKKGKFKLSIAKRQNSYSQVRSKLVTKQGKPTKSKVSLSQQQQQTSTCDFCQTQFTSVEEYSTHCKNCTIRCTCPFCGTTFQAMKELRKHMFTQHGLSDDESESTEVSVGEAAASSKSSKFTCSECGMCLSTASNLQRHMRCKHLSTKKQNTASKVKPRFYCSVCNMSLYTAKSFRKHQRKHPTKRTGKSEGKHKNALSPLKKRKNVTETDKSEEGRNVSPQKKRKHFTETGKSEDKHRNALSPPKSRKQAKLPERKYKCDECGVCLSNFHNLKRHKLIHARKKSVSNKVKGDSPKKLDDDKKKMRKFRCGICGEYFNHLFNLERHAMTHSEPTPYQCQVCFTRFSQLQHLHCHFEKFHIMDS